MAFHPTCSYDSITLKVCPLRSRFWIPSFESGWHRSQTVRLPRINDTKQPAASWCSWGAFLWNIVAMLWESQDPRKGYMQVLLLIAPAKIPADGLNCQMGQCMNLQMSLAPSHPVTPSICIFSSEVSNTAEQRRATLPDLCPNCSFTL